MPSGRFSLRLPTALALLLASLYSFTARAELPDPLIVSSSSSWEPFSFVDTDGQARGVFVELWRAIAAEDGVDVEFLLLDWDESIAAVADGRAHVHAGLIRSEQRAGLLEFGTTLIEATPTLFVDPALGVDSLRDFADLPIGIIQGGYEEDFLRQNYPQIRREPYPDSRTMINDALAGRIAAFIDSSDAAHHFMARNGAVGRFVPRQALYREPLRPAVAIGEVELLVSVNDAIARLGVDGIERIKDRYLLLDTDDAAAHWRRAFGAAVVAGVLLLAALLWQQVRLGSARQELGQAVIELERVNHRVGELESSDSLTGLANRRHFHEIAWQELARARRYGHQLALVLLDIDHARDINDRYGQDTGDRALIHLAHILQRHLRETDLLARHGGEEFTLLLPGTDRDGAIKLVQRMLATAEEHPLLNGDDAIPVLFSAGIAVFASSDNDLDALLGEADLAMQRAKAAGRARVVG